MMQNEAYDFRLQFEQLIQDVCKLCQDLTPDMLSFSFYRGVNCSIFMVVEQLINNILDEVVYQIGGDRFSYVQEQCRLAMNKDDIVTSLKKCLKGVQTVLDNLPNSIMHLYKGSYSNKSRGEEETHITVHASLIRSVSHCAEYKAKIELLVTALRQQQNMMDVR